MFNPTSELTVHGKTPEGISVDVTIKAFARGATPDGSSGLAIAQVHNVTTCLLIALNQALRMLTCEPEEAPAPKLRVLDFEALKKTVSENEDGKGD